MSGVSEEEVVGYVPSDDTNPIHNGGNSGVSVATVDLHVREDHMVAVRNNKLDPVMTVAHALYVAQEKPNKPRAVTEEHWNQVAHYLDGLVIVREIQRCVDASLGLDSSDDFYVRNKVVNKNGKGLSGKRKDMKSIVAGMEFLNLEDAEAFIEALDEGSYVEGVGKGKIYLDSKEMADAWKAKMVAAGAKEEEASERIRKVIEANRALADMSEDEEVNDGSDEEGEVKEEKGDIKEEDRAKAWEGGSGDMSTIKSGKKEVLGKGARGEDTVYYVNGVQLSTGNSKTENYMRMWEVKKLEHPKELWKLVGGLISMSMRDLQRIRSMLELGQVMEAMKEVFEGKLVSPEVIDANVQAAAKLVTDISEDYSKRYEEVNKLKDNAKKESVGRLMKKLIEERKLEEAKKQGKSFFGTSRKPNDIELSADVILELERKAKLTAKDISDIDRRWPDPEIMDMAIEKVGAVRQVLVTGQLDEYHKRFEEYEGVGNHPSVEAMLSALDEDHQDDEDRDVICAVFHGLKVEEIRSSMKIIDDLIADDAKALRDAEQVDRGMGRVGAKYGDLGLTVVQHDERTSSDVIRYIRARTDSSEVKHATEEELMELEEAIANGFWQFRPSDCISMKTQLKIVVQHPHLLRAASKFWKAPLKSPVAKKLTNGKIYAHLPVVNALIQQQGHTFITDDVSRKGTLTNRSMYALGSVRGVATELLTSKSMGHDLYHPIAPSVLRHIAAFLTGYIKLPLPNRYVGPTGETFSGRTHTMDMIFRLEPSASDRFPGAETGTGALRIGFAAAQIALNDLATKVKGFDPRFHISIGKAITDALDAGKVNRDQLVKIKEVFKPYINVMYGYCCSQDKYRRIFQENEAVKKYGMSDQAAYAIGTNIGEFFAGRNPDPFRMVIVLKTVLNGTAILVDSPLAHDILGIDKASALAADAQEVMRLTNREMELVKDSEDRKKEATAQIAERRLQLTNRVADQIVNTGGINLENMGEMFRILGLDRDG